jgi:hypothetical protein
MDLDAARTAIAAAAPAGVTGYPRPPGHLPHMPALVVGDPVELEYHVAAKLRHEAIIPLRLIVSRSAEQDSTAELDTLISYDQVPAALEAAAPSGYTQIVIESCSGGYAEYVQDGRPIGLAADLTARVVFTTGDPA